MTNPEDEARFLLQRMGVSNVGDFSADDLGELTLLIALKYTRTPVVNLPNQPFSRDTMAIMAIMASNIAAGMLARGRPTEGDDNIAFWSVEMTLDITRRLNAELTKSGPKQGLDKFFTF